MKVLFISLGCDKNLVDAETMLGYLSQKGYEITDDETEAEAVVVNTCCFIHDAKQESVDAILEMADLRKEGRVKALIVTGCLAQRYSDEIQEEIPEVDVIMGTQAIEDIVEALENVLAGEAKNYLPDIDKPLPKLGKRMITTGGHYAYLKIAEGCDNRCTYCAIPKIRGKFRSRTIESIVEEAKKLEASGVKELNIIAQDTTRYGLDIYGEYKLADLIREITKNTQIPWIRLLYCYPDKITDSLIDELRENDRLLKYIDLPIQHISDKVLSSMNRHGDSSMIKDTVKRLRDGVPGIVIRSTVIVGFPGETDEDFQELCSYIKEAKFDRLGAFTYSREEDTPAYDLDDQIDEQIKQDRYDIIMTEQQTIIDTLNEGKVGEVIKVIVEGYDPDNKIFFGRSGADAPDIDTKVLFRGQNQLMLGSFVNVRITETLDYDLLGEIVF